MLDALLSLAVLLPVVVGWGALARRAILGEAALAVEGWALDGLWGLGALTSAGLLLNLLVPLDDRATLPIALLGAAGFVARCARRRWRPLGQTARSLGLVLLLAFACAASGVLHGSEYETGLYHLQALLWMRGSPLPLGLANLQPQLGHPGAWLSFAAALWLPGLGLRGPFCANLLAYLIALGALASLARTAQGRSGLGTGAGLGSALRVLPVLSLAALSLPGGRFHLFAGGSPSGDAPAMLLCLLALSLAPAAARAATAQQRLARTGDLFLACALAVAVKLSAAPIVLLACAALLPGARRRSRGRGLSLRTIALPVSLALALALRNLAATGCPAYPADALCLQLPWTAPPWLRAAARSMIRDWAMGWRSEQGAPTLAQWLPGWLELVRSDPAAVAAAALLAAGLVVLAVVLVRRRAARLRALPLLAPLVTALAGAGFWFFAAPDPRLGYGFLVGAPAVVWAMAALALPATVRLGALRALRSASLGGLVLHGALAALVLSRAPAGWWPEIAAARVHAEPIEGGSIQVAEQPPGLGAQCWGTPPPCSSIHQPGLTSRRLLGRPAFLLPR
jgi:hypothetical protein